jgi:hypothetical protein
MGRIFWLDIWPWGQIFLPLGLQQLHFWEGYKYPSLLLPQAARPTIEAPHIWSHKFHKISSLNPPKLLIFGESKKKALIYIFTEAIHFSLSFA